MSDTFETSLFRRLSHTPMRDIVRGRVTGRLDVARRVDAANLPAPAAELIKRVVRRTRLWRLERAAVADDLVAHFADGLASGESVDELIASFGDERRAATLIGRAKRGARPVAWQAVRATGWLFVALAAFYVAAGVYFFVGRPRPSVDYVAELNRPVNAVPESQRAWPVYRQALLALGEPLGTAHTNRLTSSHPGDKHWPAATEWLARHADAIELMRHAASRPSMGFVFGAAGSASDPQLFPAIAERAATTMPDGVRHDAGDDPLVAILLPHLNQLRHVSDVLAVDAAAAREAGDRERLMRDLLALHAMGEQQAKEPFLIGQFVALGLRSHAVSQIGQTIAAKPEALTDADLRDLAHCLSGPDVATDLVNLDRERMFFYDAVQRAYTDDGDGGGRLTPAGIKVLAEITSSNRPTHADPFDEPAAAATGPAAMLLAGSRKDAVATYDAIMDATAAQYARPIRDVDPNLFEERLNALGATATARLKNKPLLVLMPSLHRMQVAAERHLGMRDGVVIGIAFELHRRRNAGAYPDTLAALTPALLPSVPTDRITGQPVQYRLIDGRPVVYSVGADRDDDGGKPPMHRRGGKIAPSLAADWVKWSAELPAPDGDWVLYPEPVVPPEEPATDAAE